MGGIDKLRYEINDIPLLVYTLMALDACIDIDEVVVATNADQIIAVGDMVRHFYLTKTRHIVSGGENRIQSVLSGLGAISARSDLVAIHDGARPLTTPELISEVIHLAAACGAAAPAVPVKDTIKEVDGNLVKHTPDRSAFMLVQTPQVFEPGLIKGALTRALSENLTVTDDCAAVESMGMRVLLSRGSYENIKVTTPEDLIFCEALLTRRLP
jgi:2-C-methyl-D-erythritol 4-phosphate cytidylyltransferase